MKLSPLKEGKLYLLTEDEVITIRDALNNAVEDIEDGVWRGSSSNEELVHVLELFLEDDDGQEGARSSLK
jgi:hypothetical protein